GLLPDAPELQREVPVDGAGPLATHPDLDEHDGGAFQRGAQIAGVDQPVRLPGRPQHPLAHARHQLEPVSGRVDQHDLVEGQQVLLAGKAIDELRGVGRRSTDYDDLHSTSSYLSLCTNCGPGLLARQRSRTIISISTGWFSGRLDVPIAERA